MKKTILYIAVAICSIAISCSNNSTEHPSLQLGYNYFEVWYDTKGCYVDIKSTDAWSATTDCEWITITTPSNEAGASQLQFAITENLDNEAREGVITIRTNNSQLSAILTVKQYEKREEYMQITYVTNNGKEVEISTPNAFNANIISNTYANGEGVIKFDATLTSIQTQAFYGNAALKHITLPESLAKIEEWAFSACVCLTKANIPERVTHIGSMAFAYCNQLQEIVIPESVIEIGESAFCGCSGLTRIAGKFASADERCLVIDNVLVQFAPKGVNKYTIADGITAIEHDAFYESLSLREITIPSSVKSIGDYAFYYCESLKNVYCKANIPPTLGVSVFDNFDNGTDTPIGCTIHVPTASVDAYKNAANWKNYKKYINGYTF